MPEHAGEFDYIIVGAGSAGCVMANRLSKNAGTSVLVLEAGHRAGGFMVDMPAGLLTLMGRPETDWCYPVEHDDTIADRHVVWSGGRMLGGSSGINGMVYIRGSRGDFKEWAEAGGSGWSFDALLPYFMKSECFNGPPGPFHGTDGPLQVSPPRSIHPLAHAFVDACASVGIPARPDYCGGDVTGSFIMWSTTGRGQRSSTYKAFLKPVMKRPNLAVKTGAEVERLLFEGKRAVGVEVIENGEPRTYRARREVVLSAGAIASPAILLRSGIGPAADLANLGIPVVADLPVGLNLQEHLGAVVSKHVNVPTYNSPMGPLHLAWHGMKYLLAKRGPMTSPTVQAMAFVKSDPDLDEPDICLNMVPLMMDLSEAAPKLHAQPGIGLYSQVCRPNARGKISLRSPSVRDKPRIDFRMLADQHDLDRLVYGTRLVERIFAAPPLARYVTGAGVPPRADLTDEQVADHVRKYISFGYHPCSTCRMGQGDEAVVDPELRVRGVDGLRVADASIMPRITSGNTNAPSIMIGEKAADLIARG